MRVDKFVLSTMNKKTVINTIRTQGPINIAEIAKIVGLSIPTVMKLVDEFILSGLVEVTGKGESKGGKRPELLQFVVNAYYVVGVDIGRSHLKAVCTNLSGDLVCKAEIPTGNVLPESDLIDRICGLMEEVIRESKIPRGRFLGIGIGMPGIIDIDNGIVLFSPDFDWNNVPLLELVGRKIKDEKGLILPSAAIIMDNSTRALAMGENWFGAGAASNNLMCVNLGHGIGSAIISEGEFFRGSSGSSGELGHITLEKEGPLCACGNRGCLEALASGRAIEQAGKACVQNGGGALILKHAHGDIESIEAKTVFDAARRGDQDAKGIISRAAEYIGIALAGCINLLDPDKIIFAGRLALAGDLFIHPIHEAAKKRQMKYAGRKVKFETAKLGLDATAIGAATLVIKKFIEQGASVFQ